VTELRSLYDNFQGNTDAIEEKTKKSLIEKIQTYVENHGLKPIKEVKTSTSNNIDFQLELLNNKINALTNIKNQNDGYDNEQHNLKYQNMILQKTITKYLDDCEEKKILNNKIDKIYELINYNIVSKESNKLSNNIEINYTTISIVIIIILFIIDIILRLLPVKNA
jgi:hypothetical protein